MEQDYFECKPTKYSTKCCYSKKKKKTIIQFIIMLLLLYLLFENYLLKYYIRLNFL